jgi:hypothetical protein
LLTNLAIETNTAISLPNKTKFHVSPTWAEYTKQIRLNKNICPINPKRQRGKQIVNNFQEKTNSNQLSKIVKADKSNAAVITYELNSNVVPVTGRGGP